MKPDAPRDSPAAGPGAGPAPGAAGASDRLTPGTLISRKVRVDALIGQGGMALVYKGHHLMLDEPVAVKVLRRELLGMKDVVARFLREARAAAKVRNEHAVIVYDVDELESGQPYMLMELLAGEDLAARSERLGRLPISEAVSIILQACIAVRVAHDAGIVHRDIKPGNLFIAQKRGGGETVKVLDFGISKVMTPTRGQGAAEGPASSITSVGALLGSPRYMAPEQMIDARNVDARSDVWSLSCTLYRLVTGRPAFDGDSVPIICTNVLTFSPDPAHVVAGDIPVALGEVIAKGMSKDRDDRHADIAAFVAALTPFADPVRSRVLVATAAAPVTTAGAPASDLDERSTKRLAAAPSPIVVPSVASSLARPGDGTEDEPRTRVVASGPTAPGIGAPLSPQASPFHGSVPGSTMVSSNAPLQAPPGAAPPSTFDGLRAPDAPIDRGGSSAGSGRAWPLIVVGVGIALTVVAVGLWRVRVVSSGAATPGEPAAARSHDATSAPAAPLAPSAAAPSVLPVAPSDAPMPGESAAAAASAAPSSSAPSPSHSSSGGRRPARGREVPGSSPSLPDPFGGEQK